jgi:hypothetical protein
MAMVRANFWLQLNLSIHSFTSTKEHKIMSFYKSGMVVSSAIASAAICLTPFSAFAGSDLFDDTFSTCTGINCSSLRLPGSILNYGPFAGTFDIKLYASFGECMRLDVISANGGQDLEITVTSPNGTVYRNDDGGGGGVFNNPLVKIGSTPSRGWYTVHIAQYAGASINADFTLLYGRYNAGNPNCAAPTAPSLAGAGSSSAKPGLQVLPPSKPGGNPSDR